MLAILALTLLVLLGSRTCTSAQEIDWEDIAEGASYPTERLEVPQWRLTNGPHVRSAFRDVVTEAREATVRVRSDGRDISLGGIVGADGWIITKASNLDGKITCLLSDQRELKAKIVDFNREYDIALLKVGAERLPTLKLNEVKTPAVGSWLATVGMKRGPLAVGVVSVESREIPHRAGILGLRFDFQAERAIVEQIFPNTAAEKAGLQPDDEFLSVDGQPTPTRESFVLKIRDYSPGDHIRLKLKRDGETLEIGATLQGKRPWALPSREDFQNSLGSKLSNRRFGFPQAFQHDTVVKPSDCGGPVVDLDGQVVGFNIARAGRTETYAIPTSVALEIVRKLKS